MKIAASSITMAASHVHSREYRVSERLEVWHEQRRPAAEPRVSAEARALQESAAAPRTDNGSDDDVPPELAMLRQLVEYLTGRSVRLFNPAELRRAAAEAAAAAPDASPGTPAAGARVAQGWGVDYQREEVYHEAQMVDFRASGTIQTADGQSFQFEASLAMAREVTLRSSTHLELGDGARPRKDPLVINYAAPAARLLDSTVSFDVDSDGSADTVQRLATGSGYLALDRNADGVINNGTELFGTRSGDGLADLSAFDDDRNGWIDENDAVWGSLRLWVQDQAGTLLTLREASVGAIFLGSVDTPMQLDSANGTAGGEINRTGLFLHEDGAAGTVQQIDLFV